MKMLPQSPPNWRALNDLIGGGLRYKIFTAAIRLKIFDHVADYTSDEIAASLSAHPKNTERLLNALVSLGLISKKQGRYSLPSESAQLLVSSSPTYVADYLLHGGAFHEHFPQSIEELVLEGPPTSPFSIGNEEIWADSARRAAAYQYSGEAQHLARIISALPEFEDASSLLDIGGGAGFFAMAVAQAHPSLRAVIFEQPAVAQVAQEFIQEYGMEERVSVIAGDYSKDPLQGPYDLILASATLNFFKPNLKAVLSRIYDALSEGGVFLSHQDGLRQERTHPANRVTEFLYPALVGNDFSFEEGEIAETLISCGFQSVRSFTKHSSIGEMQVDIARKAKRG